MGILSILSELAEVGITQKQLDKALVESTEAREAVICKTKQVQQYWKSIAPVTDRKAHPVQKGSDEIIHPGDYRDSIKVKYEKGKSGELIGVVYVDEKIAPHAKWIEYGSLHNEVGGYMQKVSDHFQGVEAG